MAELKNTGSGNNALLVAPYTLVPADHAVTYGAGGGAATDINLPRDYDWLVIEVYDNNGNDNSGYTLWSDNVVGILSRVEAVRAEMLSDTTLTSFTIEATHYKAATSKADTYFGDELIPIAINLTDTNFFFVEQPLIFNRYTITPRVYTAFDMEYTTTIVSSQVDFTFTAGPTVTVTNIDTGIVVATSTTGAITVPAEAAIYRYAIQSTGVITTFACSQTAGRNNIDEVIVYGIDDMTNMNSMFTSCHQTKKIYILADMGNVTTLSSTFYGTSILEELVVNNTTNVVTWTNCFYGCGLDHVPDSFDFSGGVTFTGTWKSSLIASFPIINFTNGENFYGAWENADQLVTFPHLVFPAATTLSRAWALCDGLTSHGGFTVSLVWNFSQTFYWSPNIISIGAINRDNTVAAAFNEMFRQVYALDCLHSIDSTNWSSNTDMFGSITALSNPTPAEVALLIGAGGYNYVNGNACP